LRAAKIRQFAKQAKNNSNNDSFLFFIHVFAFILKTGNKPDSGLQCHL
jgi:hypothetical protein